MTKLEKIGTLTFPIVFQEGGRISSGASSLEIGAVIESNLSVLRNPANGEPYVPGSSLKGKIRCTAERIAGKIGPRGEPHGQNCEEQNCVICQVFGPHKNTRSECGPTRITVRDAYFTEAYRTVYEGRERDNQPVLEEKSENTIDRDRGTAGNPRTMERLLPGAAFAGVLVLRIYQGDDKDKFVKTILQAMSVIQEGDSIGAGGSRGSGHVKFGHVEILWQDVSTMTIPFTEV
jgi:CRISPR-associated protein Csm3